MSSNPEKINFGQEKKYSPEHLKDIGAERSKELIEERERHAEQAPESSTEALQEALEVAKNVEHEEKPETPIEHRKKGPITKASRDASFNATMKEVQGQMSAPSRAFSKVIHNKAVEKVSEVAASTIARPNALLSGAIFAFILTLSVYLIAKNLGFQLSGFEPIGAFILGWILGVTYDFLKVMVTGRK